MLPDFGWFELLVIGIVLIVVVGPKDLPRVVKGFGKGMKSVRRLSADFQKQFSDAMDEAELSELRDTVREVKKLDPRKQIKDAMKPLADEADEFESDWDEAVAKINKSNKLEKKPSAKVDDALDAAGAKPAEIEAAPDLKPKTTKRATSRRKTTTQKTTASKAETAGKATATKTTAKPAAAKASSSAASTSSTLKKTAGKKTAGAKPKTSTRKPRKAAAKPAPSSTDNAA
ncbi:MAG: Sec-independent protein translocase protein TatB [Pseudomonadota bacterium]